MALGDSNEDLLAKDLTEQERGRVRQAVAELDQAAVQTIHSFAAQLLRDRPLSANLPPGWVPLDACGLGRAFCGTMGSMVGEQSGSGPRRQP